MLHLVIASGKYCDKNIIIRTGTYEELSSYTTKFNDSKELRDKNKKVVNKFFERYHLNGDIVIMDDSNNTRVRVLYKNDVKIVKELVKSQNLLKYLVENSILLVSEYDYKAIMYYKNKDYLKHINTYLKSRKSYYETIRIILKGYEKYQKKHKELPSIYCMKKEIINSKKNKDEAVFYDLNSDIKNEGYYEDISYTYSRGGYEEVFNNYSLDELGENLADYDFKRLVKSGYHK